MKQYLDVLSDILHNGVKKTDPQGVGNLAVFVREMRFKLDNGFPLVTTKKVNFRYVLGELLWFLTGASRVDFLRENRIPIWNLWATEEICRKYGLEEGDLGKIYGPQWIYWEKRNGRHINQIKVLVDQLKSNPDSRRLKVIAWNPEDVDGVAVAPCHGDFKCFVADKKISLHLNQRSADYFIGIPYNIASYATLLMMLGQVCGYQPDELIITTEDSHIYLNHIEQVKLQLSREPRQLPQLIINPEIENIFSFHFSDFKLEGYNPYPFIGADVGV